MNVKTNGPLLINKCIKFCPNDYARAKELGLSPAKICQKALSEAIMEAESKPFQQSKKLLYKDKYL